MIKYIFKSLNVQNIQQIIILSINDFIIWRQYHVPLDFGLLQLVDETGSGD